MRTILLALMDYDKDNRKPVRYKHKITVGEGMCVCCMPEHEFGILFCIPLRHDLSLNLQLGWQSGSPALPLFPQSGRVMAIYIYSHTQLFMWLRGPKLRPLSSWRKCFYLWAISPAHIQFCSISFSNLFKWLKILLIFSKTLFVFQMFDVSASN